MRTRLGLALTLLVLAAGCAPSGNEVAGGASSVSAPTAAGPSITGEASGGSGGSGGCGGPAGDAVVDALAAYDSVTSVDVIGGCTMVSVSTSLPPGDALSESAATAVEMCEAAAEVAYVGDVSSVNVDGSDGHELAIGLQGMDCIPG
jgi:hypothetical protein